MLNFTAIDFETANGKRESACSLGVAKVEDGKVTVTKSFLIKPHSDYRQFNGVHIGIHGIRPYMVASAPTWEQVSEEFQQIVGTDILVAHNMAFDFSVLDRINKLYRLPWSPAGTICTMKASRSALTLPDHKLPTIARHLGVLGELNHHEAGSDAFACARIALALCEHLRVDDIKQIGGDYHPGAKRTTTKRKPATRSTVHR